MRVGDAEYSLSGERGHCSLFVVVVQHVINVAAVTVQVEALGYLAFLASIVQSHRRKYRFYLEVKSTQREKGVGIVLWINTLCENNYMYKLNKST